MHGPTCTFSANLLNFSGTFLASAADALRAEAAERKMGEEQLAMLQTRLQSLHSAKLLTDDERSCTGVQMFLQTRDSVERDDGRSSARG